MLPLWLKYSKAVKFWLYWWVNMVTKSKNERHKDTGKSYISNINIILLLFFKYQNTISLWCRTYYRKYWNSWNYENACCLYFITISLVFKLCQKISCFYSISAIVSSWNLAHVRWRRTVRWALSSIRISYFGRRIWKPNEGKKLPARKQFGKLRNGFPLKKCLWNFANSILDNQFEAASRWKFESY